MELNYREELEAALEAAKTAGNLMEESRRDGVQNAEVKESETDLVTETDRKCQRKIIEILEQRFPDDGFLAEEDAVSPDGENRVWVIDPIDGTLNFSKGFPYFCCSIGLRVDGEYVAGVVLSPDCAVGRYYFGSSGSGAYSARVEEPFEDADPIEVSEMGMEGARIGFDYSRSDSTERYFEGGKAKYLLDEGAAIGRAGAAALNLCMVASGGLDGMIAHVNEWDYAAGSVIVEEAGGKMETDQLENGLTEVLASNGQVHTNLLNIARADH